MCELDQNKNQILFSWFYECNFLVLFLFQTRRAKLHPQKQRSKYICKPDAVVEAGNHFVWEFVTGRGSLNVPADAGILHHYRVSDLFFVGNCSSRDFSKINVFQKWFLS